MLADAHKEFERIRQALASMPNAAKLTTEYARLQRQFRDLQNFQLDKSKLDALSELRKAVQAIQNTDATESICRALAEMQTLRNNLAHAAVTLPRLDTVKPAYTLDDEDNHG